MNVLFRTAIFTIVAAIGLFASAPLANAVSLLDGQNHYYTVQFRSDNKAVVYAKLVFQNGNNDKERDTFTFTLPDGVDVESLSVQQILAKNSNNACLRYETYDEYYARTGFAPTTTRPNTQSLLCVEKADIYDDDFDFVNNQNNKSYYYDYYYPRYRISENYEYSNLTPGRDGSTYTVKLSHAIKPHKQGAVLVSFTSQSYVSGFMGRFNYSFRTFKSNELIERANVAINFDEELYSRDVTQKRTIESSTDSSSIAIGASVADEAYSSKSTDSIISSVGQGGLYTRTQTNLLPNDIMNVNGVYATAPVLLYATEILVTLILFVLAAILTMVSVRRYKKRHPHAQNDVTAATDSTTSNISRWATTFTAKQSVSTLRLLSVSGASAVATIIALLLFWVLISIADGSYNNAAVQMVIAIYAIAVLGVTSFVGPFVYVLRYGVRGVFTWLIINAIVISLLSLVVVGFISFTSGSPDYPNYPYPM